METLSKLRRRGKPGVGPAAVRVLRDREYVPALLRAVERARQSIVARFFLIDPGLGGEGRPVLGILETLRKAKRRGVRVQILTDGVFRAKPSGKRLLATARKLGLPIAWDDKRSILHEKTVAIDGRLVILGSHNWTPPSLLENRELSVRLPHSVKVLDAQQFSKTLLEDIEGARKEVTLASFAIDESSNPYGFGTKITRSLIRAKERGLKVRILLDASQLRAPETGELLYLYRGERKAEELARARVHVYYDTTATLFHAKVAVIDDRFVYIGSQNLEVRKDGRDLEATVRLDSKKISAEIKTYLAEVLRASTRFRDDPRELTGMPIPFSFLERRGILSRMFSNGSEGAFRFYISLVRECWKQGSSRIERPWPLGREKLARSVLEKNYKALHRLPGGRFKRPQVTLVDPGTGKPLAFSRDGAFIIPESFFELGWWDRLSHREIFAFWIHLAESQRSRRSSFWSMRSVDLARKFGMDRSSWNDATIALERWNLIEVIRDPKITVRGAKGRPNRYRLNGLWSLEEARLAKKKMLQELSMSAKDLEVAERLAARLNQTHDLGVIRKFLLLIDRYGLEEVKRAASITARFAPQFALRNVHYVAAILRRRASAAVRT